MLCAGKNSYWGYIALHVLTGRQDGSVFVCFPRAVVRANAKLDRGTRSEEARHFSTCVRDYSRNAGAAEACDRPVF